jgi:hypothetical protein
MKKIFLVVLSIIVSYTIYSQVFSKMPNNIKDQNRNTLIGTKFPNLEVQSLAKMDIKLPLVNADKPTILCIVFERNSQSKVDTWTIPIFEKYTETQVNYYEVPMISGTFKLASNFIDNGMRGGVPKDLHDNVATYYGKMDDYRADLMMADKNSCYLFLLDNEGIIKHIDESVANPQKIKNLATALEKLNIATRQ